MNVNFGLPFVTVHNVESDEWCKKYDLEIFTRDCKKCGKIVTLNIPFATKYRRGIYANQCSCGNKSTPFSYIDFSFES